jgi:ATP-dependent Lon protease
MITRSNKKYGANLHTVKFSPTLKKKHNKRYNKELEKFSNNIEAIYDGSFFERIPLDDQHDKIRNSVSIHELVRLNDELSKLKSNYQKACPSVIDILKTNLPTNKKQDLLEKIHLFTNSEPLSQEYNLTLKNLNDKLTCNPDQKLINLEKEINERCNNYDSDNDLKVKLLNSPMSMENKVIAYNRFKILNSYKSDNADSSEFFKYKVWIDTLLQIPFGIYKNPKLEITDPTHTGYNNGIRNYLKNIRTVLDNKLSYLEKPKDQILNMITHTLKNKDAKFNAIGLHGVRGLGKTTLISSISEAIDRPFRMISLGGESDVSMLTGHNFTYIGSIPGRIIEILKETQCMNPIILFDELDKVSETEHGKEIIGALIHLTDNTTNHKYNYDKYFSGIEFDLSKIMFVFTYNDSTKINKILSDRLYKINIENYTDNEKFTIVKTHMISNVLSDYFFTQNDIVFSDETIRYIIKKSNENGQSEGMRDIKRKLQIIISRINTLLLTSKSDEIVKLSYNVLYDKYTSLPIHIKNNDIDILLSKSDSNDNSSIKFNDPPFHMYM